MDKLQQIRKLMDELEAELKAEKKQGIKLNTGRFMVYGDGSISSNTCQWYEKVNNIWKTEQQAEQARNIMSAIFELKQIADEINGDWKPDWKNDDEYKYYVMFNHAFSMFSMATNQHLSRMCIHFKRYCLDEILPIMSDNLKAFIKGELQ